MSTPCAWFTPELCCWTWNSKEGPWYTIPDDSPALINTDSISNSVNEDVRMADFKRVNSVLGNPREPVQAEDPTTQVFSDKGLVYTDATGKYVSDKPDGTNISLW